MKLMESDKYFTPNIEDIRCNYQCELLIKGKFKPVILGKEAIATIVNNVEKYIRVLYLTKEQIKSEGWKHMWEDESHSWGKDDYILTTWDNNKRILIDYSTRRLIDIECKDINTLRYLSKLLNIK